MNSPCDAHLDLPLDVEQVLRGGARSSSNALLHLRVLDRIELERAECRVEHDEKVAAPHGAETRPSSGRFRPCVGRGGPRAPSRSSTSRSARAHRVADQRLLVLRRRLERRARLGSADFARAPSRRRRASRDLPCARTCPWSSSTFASAATPSAPRSVPYASKNAIFSVRSALLELRPRHRGFHARAAHCDDPATPGTSRRRSGRRGPVVHALSEQRSAPGEPTCRALRPPRASRCGRRLSSSGPSRPPRR